jgi:hypothetical protein
MTTKVFVFYNLKEGVDVEKYKEWSRTVDQPACNNLEICHKFEVFLIEGEASGKPFYQVAEDVEVESFEAWQAALQSEEFSHVMEQWPLYGDGDSAIVMYGEKI